MKTVVCLHLFGLSRPVKFRKKHKFICGTATFLLKGILENPPSHCSVRKVVQMCIRLLFCSLFLKISSSKNQASSLFFVHILVRTFSQFPFFFTGKPFC